MREKILLKSLIMIMMISLVLPIEVFGAYDETLLNETDWFNLEQVNTNRSRGVALYFLILLIIVLLVFYGEHMKIGLVMLFAALMGFFYSFLLYTTISAVIGGIFTIVSLLILFRGLVIANE